MFGSILLSNRRLVHSSALKLLPIGTAYAVWTGIGALGTVIVGMILFGEPSNLLRMMFVLFIVVGIIGLKVTSH